MAFKCQVVARAHVISGVYGFNLAFSFFLVSLSHHGWMDGRDLVYIKVYRGEGEEERVEVVCALQSLVIGGIDTL